jgi:hypothetical protein
MSEIKVGDVFIRAKKIDSGSNLLNNFKTIIILQVKGNRVSYCYGDQVVKPEHGFSRPSDSFKKEIDLGYIIKSELLTALN